MAFTEEEIKLLQQMLKVEHKAIHLAIEACTFLLSKAALNKAGIKVFAKSLVELGLGKPQVRIVIF